MQNLIVTIIS